MRLLTAFAFVGLLGGCDARVTNADQDNFSLHAGARGIEPLVAALERRLRTSAISTELKLNSDPARIFRMDGRGVTVLIVPVPDDRCNPNAPYHSTYKQGEYRIDFVYQTKSATKRQAAKEILGASARDAAQSLTPFEECK